MKNGYINNITAIFIISVALLFDGTQAFLDLFHIIPIVGNIFVAVANWIISVLALFVFWFWFFINGVRFNSPKRMLTMGGSFIIELIPILDMLPAWTLAVVLIILTARLPKSIQPIVGGVTGGGKGLAKTSVVGATGVDAGAVSGQKFARVVTKPYTKPGFDKRPNRIPDRIPNNGIQSSDGIRRST